MSYLANPEDLGDADWYLNRWPAVDEPLIDVGADDIPGLNPNVRMRSDGCIIDLSESTLWLDLNYCSQRTAQLGRFQFTTGFSYNKAWNNDGCCVTVEDFVFSYGVVPEPLTVVLLGSGLLGVVGIASYRRRRLDE